MRIPRVILPDTVQTGAETTLPPEEALHVARVLRRRAGDELRLIASNGVFAGTVAEISGDARAPVVRVLVGEVVNVDSRVVPWTIAIAIVKRGAFEDALRVASELGIACVVPVLAGRSVKRPPATRDAVARWARIARESAKQCDRMPVEVAAPQPLDAWVRNIAAGASEPPAGESWWIAVPGAPTPGAADLYETRATFAVGPEGGFAPGEIELAESCGFRPCGFPTPVLRTPTAVALIGALGVLAGRT